MDPVKELLKKREETIKKLESAKKAMGLVGTWRGSDYEVADQNIRLYTARLQEIEERLAELKREKV